MSNTETVGLVKVTVCIRFNQNVSMSDAIAFVNEMDYEIKDTTGKVSIADTEIVEGVDFDDYDENKEKINLIIEDKNRRHGTYGPEYSGEKF